MCFQISTRLIQVVRILFEHWLRRVGGRLLRLSRGLLHCNLLRLSWTWYLKQITSKLFGFSLFAVICQYFELVVRFGHLRLQFLDCDMGLGQMFGEDRIELFGGIFFKLIQLTYLSSKLSFKFTKFSLKSFYSFSRGHIEPTRAVHNVLCVWSRQRYYLR